MSEREYSICIDCKHQDGIWVNDSEVDVWCKLGKTNDCDGTFECEYFEEITCNCEHCVCEELMENLDGY